jgi:hypothetical protein
LFAQTEVVKPEEDEGAETSELGGESEVCGGPNSGGKEEGKMV